MKSLIQIKNYLWNQITGLVLIIKGLFRLLKKGRLNWLVYIEEGRLRYNLNALYSGIKMNRNGKGKLFNFRRNIHRIEKGLSQKNLKDTFAEDYILDTVNYLAQSNYLKNSDKIEVAWGKSVLSQYFLRCSHTVAIAKAYTIFKKLSPKNDLSIMYPYPEKDRPKLAVEYKDMYQLALRRRSIRQYIDKVVEVDVIEKAMKVAALSPSACNRQSFRFLFYNDKHTVNKISNIPGGIDCYKVPSIIVVVGIYRGYFDERDHNVPVIDASLTAMAFIFGLETLGLSSVCVNWPALPDCDEAIRKVIHLEDDEFIVMLIGVGYPDPEGKIPYSAKRDISELLLSNKLIENKKI
ncbi:MAG TPA: nitroreductase family protein [Desulfobacteraceae bacterium]|nr:nitroreductase family protein [Desulfobacteraceae bacterium]HPJ67537.1 nitroreductase family protein [Desulfobacteraceae bacterium]HPQ28498.1 nitroreductase family protein [Desulfobacteraceae bacterium]